MPRRVKQYICVVDGYRRPSRERNTTGRYQVAARNPRHAKQILQKAIGFGSVQVYYEQDPKDCSVILPMGQCRQEMPGGMLRPVRHATDPIDKYDDSSNAVL